MRWNTFVVAVVSIINATRHFQCSGCPVAGGGGGAFVADDGGGGGGRRCWRQNRATAQKGESLVAYRLIGTSTNTFLRCSFLGNDSDILFAHYISRSLCGASTQSNLHSHSNTKMKSTIAILLCVLLVVGIILVAMPEDVSAQWGYGRGYGGYGRGFGGGYGRRWGGGGGGWGRGYGRGYGRRWG